MYRQRINVADCVSDMETVEDRGDMCWQLRLKEPLVLKRDGLSEKIKVEGSENQADREWEKANI